MKQILALAVTCAVSVSSTCAFAKDRDLIVIEGSYGGPLQPDGNSVIIEGKLGLILLDTGRHPAHQDKLLAAAHALNKPVVAIFNSHWHLDHSGGNAEIRAVYPDAKLYASRAINGALDGFLKAGRADGVEMIAEGKLDPAIIADIQLDVDAIDNPKALLPDIIVDRSAVQKIAGRKLSVNLAPYAATQGDVWLFDPKTRTVIAGDLVVAAVPYFDTACAEGWRRALDEIAVMPFETLVPGHGKPMSKQSFMRWRSAFNAFVDCAQSKADEASCITLWQQQAEPFSHGKPDRIAGALKYYLRTRFRVSDAEQKKYCAPA